MSSSDKPADDREGTIHPETTSDHHQDPQQITNQQKNEKEKESDEATVSDKQSGKRISEDDEGFKTPPDQRIPAITHCPPAPRKPPPSKRKRKTSPSPGARRSLQFEASTAEVESVFRPISNEQDDIQDRKIKRARTDDNDGES